MTLARGATHRSGLWQTLVLVLGLTLALTLPSQAQMTRAGSMVLGVAGADTTDGVDSAPGSGLSLQDRLTFNTFGTLGLSRLNLAGTQAIDDPAASTGIGSEWTAAYDSVLGLQTTAAVTPSLGLTVQVVLRPDAARAVRLGTQWAFAQWQPASAWEFKVGRYMSPLYLASDQRLIGLAHPWVRAPSEVYGLLGDVDALDGLWVRYRQPVGDRTLAVDLYRARHLDKRGDFWVNHRHLTGVGLNLRDARYTWHATVAQSHTEINSPSARRATEVIAMPAAGGNPDVAREYDLMQIDTLLFLAGGVRYEDGPWLVLSELVWRHADSKVLPGSVAGYLTMGYARESMLGYVTVAAVRGRDPGSETRLSGPAAEAAAAFLQFGREYGQRSISSGVRWDVQRGVALKAQIDYVRPRIQGRGGTFIDETGRYRLPAGRRVAWLYSLALDWAY